MEVIPLPLIYEEKPLGSWCWERNWWNDRGFGWTDGGRWGESRPFLQKNIYIPPWEKDDHRLKMVFFTDIYEFPGGDYPAANYGRSWSSNQKFLGMQFFRTSPANYFCESPWPKKTSKGKMCFYFMFFPDSVEMLLAAKLYSKVWIGHSKECSKQKDFRWLFEALGVGFGIFGFGRWKSSFWIQAGKVKFSQLAKNMNASMYLQTTKKRSSHRRLMFVLRADKNSMQFLHKKIKHLLFSPLGKWFNLTIISFNMGRLETTHLDSAFDPFDYIPGGVWQSTRMVGYLSLMNAVASCLAHQTFPKTLKKRDHFQMEMNNLNKSHEFSGDMWLF